MQTFNDILEDRVRPAKSVKIVYVCIISQSLLKGRLKRRIRQNS
ncbi:hypothetical protein TW89_1973 [Neisseria flavescens]|nr:hypothetical protein TW89_1973 [Neisseria flavescens]